METLTVESAEAVREHELATQAAQWHLRLQAPIEKDNIEFAKWLKTSPDHIEAYLRLTATLESFDEYILQGEHEDEEGDESQAQLFHMLQKLIEDWPPAREVYIRYSRPLLLMFVTRRIACNSALTLLQRTFIQTFQNKILVSEGDRQALVQTLHRIASKLLHEYFETPASMASMFLEHHACNDRVPLPLPRLYDRGKLSRSVKLFKRFLSMKHDSGLLMLFYVEGKSDAAICERLDISPTSFKESLWELRRLFGEILRRQALEIEHESEFDESIEAAYYVANEMEGWRKRQFELQMIGNPRFDREVELWHSIKTDLREEEASPIRAVV